MADGYSSGQVRGLIENYAELREAKATYRVGLNFLIMLCDLDRAIRLLGPKEYQAVLLHGQLRHTVRDAEQALEVSRSTLQDRYNAGVEWIVRYLNGDED